jgi:hypothetical protein
MKKTIRNSEPGLRATIEYEEAVFLLALKKLVQMEIQTINANLKGVGRISREATLLAKEDLERYGNEGISSPLADQDEQSIARRLPGHRGTTL